MSRRKSCARLLWKRTVISSGDVSTILGRNRTVDQILEAETTRKGGRLASLSTQHHRHGLERHWFRVL